MKSRLYIAVLVVGLCAIAAGWIYESRLRPQVAKAELVIPDNIDYFLTYLNYRAMDEAGELDYEFASPRLEHRRQTDVSHIELPSLQIYRKGERWQVDSGQGEFQHRENLLRLRDRVVMLKHGEDPLRLFADSIRFEPNRDLVTSESPVRLESRQARIEAEQAVLDLAGQVYSLRGARAVYHDDNG